MILLTSQMPRLKKTMRYVDVLSSYCSHGSFSYSPTGFGPLLESDEILKVSLINPVDEPALLLMSWSMCLSQTAVTTVLIGDWKCAALSPVTCLGCGMGSDRTLERRLF